MKIQKWMAAPLLSAALLTGGVAHADSLALSGGAVLDFGEKVSVLDGQRSFFGSQLHDWLLKPNAAENVQSFLEGAELVQKDDPSGKELSEMAVSILRSGKVYQVRALDNDTYYQGMVVSLAVSDGDLLKVALLKPSIPSEPAETAEKSPAPVKPSLPAEETDEAKPAEKAKTDKTSDKEEKPATPMEKALKELKSSIKVDEKSKWEEGNFKDGAAYRTADAKVSLAKDGFTIPVYVKGIISREDGKTVYTIFAADQASGNYFRPVFNKALKEAKHDKK